jgi:uncharacterized protein (TIGR02145 family)
MKKLLIALLVIGSLASCAKQEPNDKSKEATSVAKDKLGFNAAKNSNNFNICHHLPNGTWQIMNIGINGWPAHQAHGDVRLDDQDGDSYVPNNACGYGIQGDCNDNNAAIHPGLAEICNGLDDNCNGVIDEDCFSAITVCNKVWMKKNLDVVTYRDGFPITQATSDVDWDNLGKAHVGAWCYYENYAGNGPIYGKLYNWYAIHDSRGLAPAGWHIPSEAEWDSLAFCLDAATNTSPTGGIVSLIAGGTMKETGFAHWANPNTGATNSCGFTGLPGGWRDDEGAFRLLATHGMWWSSSGRTTSGDSTPGYARGRYLIYENTNLTIVNQPAPYGLSVRCVRD